MIKLVLLQFILLINFNLLIAIDQFNEELFIETLPNSNINFFFQFTTVSEQNINDESSCK